MHCHVLAHASESKIEIEAGYLQFRFDLARSYLRTGGGNASSDSAIEHVSFILARYTLWNTPSPCMREFYQKYLRLYTLLSQDPCFFALLKHR
jgi:hypothetical protein